LRSNVCQGAQERSGPQSSPRTKVVRSLNEVGND
jgi:hypothetical protein